MSKDGLFVTQIGCLDGIEQSKSLIPSLLHLPTKKDYMDNYRIIVIISFFVDAQTDSIKMLELSIHNASRQVYVDLWNVNIAYVNFY